MRIFATLAAVGLLALSATGPASAGMMGHGNQCVPFGCHER